MASALLAEDFGSYHAVAVVDVLNHVGIFALRIETGPTAVCVKFSVAYKEFGTASCTGIVARFKVLVVDSATWILSPFLTEYSELLWSQLGLPLLLCFCNVNVLRLHILWGALA